MATSSQTGADSATDYATLQFIVKSLLSRVATSTLVKVISCSNSGGLSPWGTVNVQPLISQVSGDGTAVQHGQLFKLPYLRIQGGLNAVIMDPQAGDIGLACFCARDISSMKQQSAIDQVKSGKVRGVSPGSARQYSMSDGIYLGGMLNAQPTQYIRFASNEIEVVSPTKIRLSAPVIEIVATNEVDISGTNKVKIDSAEADITGTGSIVINSPANDIKGGATKIDNKVFLTHTHSGVQSGGSNSGPVT
jgi:hypothetical protein